MSRILRAVLVVVIAVLALLPGVPVAAIANPLTPPQVSAVYVYTFSDNAVGVLVDYYLDYTAPLPTETATESFLAVFVDVDGTTQLKSAAPYTFVDSGYGRGLIWMLFTAAEAATYSLDSADQALYRIWLTGNPTLAWPADPPKTIATIDQWSTTGDMSVLLALRILYYADLLEVIWALDMIEATSVGNRLTAVGASYFENVISGCRTLAPAAFADSTTSPAYVPISYNTAFGATASNGTATIVGSPVTLSSGNNTIDTGATTGTIVVDLAQWTFGTVTNATGVVDGSPVTINPGVNTLNVTAGGTFVVSVAVVDTASQLDATVIGTGMDLTALATAFGMSRWMFSGLVWLFVSIIICAGVFKTSSQLGSPEGATKSVMALFAVCLIGGTLLGLLHPLVSAFLFIAYGFFIGYVLFLRSDALHKNFSFALWMFLIVSTAGNIAASGQGAVVTTRLTSALTATETGSIAVASTAGFPDAGIIRIGDEQITYPSLNSTHFIATTTMLVVSNPIERGSGGTTAATHAINDAVRTKESWVLNASLDYKIARLIDSAGTVAFLASPILLFDVLMTFFLLPLDFLGTDLAILTYVWMVVALGVLVGFITAVVGGRRV